MGQAVRIEIITANGPAVEGVSVTRRKHRAESWYFSQKIVTVQEGYGTCFCSHGTNFIEHWECRGTSFISDQEIVLVQDVLNGHWRSVAMQFVSEQEICQGAGCSLRATVRIQVPG